MQKVILLTMQDLASIFGVNKASVYRFIKQNKIHRPFRIGSKSYWTEEMLHDYINQLVAAVSPKMRKNAVKKCA